MSTKIIQNFCLVLGGFSAIGIITILSDPKFRQFTKEKLQRGEIRIDKH